jgi:hypothetical protein
MDLFYNISVCVFFFIFFNFDLWFFNATFNNISAIALRPVLVLEETGVPGENRKLWYKPINYLNGTFIVLKLLCNWFW